VPDRKLGLFETPAQIGAAANWPKWITEIMRTPRLMAVLAHPDDESLGMGGTLAKYASEDVDVFLLTATRGDNGRFRGYGLDDQHPGPLALANIREGELRAATSALGVREVSILDYHDHDQQLDRANPREAVATIVGHIRRVQPDVVVAFGPDGAYGHPDHIAISQFTTAATVAAANPVFHAMGSRPCSHTRCRSFTIWPGLNRPGKLTSQLSGNWSRRSN
jgi:LmbE family N-acetylglucosaminyl deacetylase